MINSAPHLDIIRLFSRAAVNEGFRILILTLGVRNQQIVQANHVAIRENRRMCEELTQMRGVLNSVMDLVRDLDVRLLSAQRENEVRATVLLDFREAVRPEENPFAVQELDRIQQQPDIDHAP